MSAAVNSEDQFQSAPATALPRVGDEQLPDALGDADFEIDLEEDTAEMSAAPISLDVDVALPDNKQQQQQNDDDDDNNNDMEIEREEPIVCFYHGARS